MATAFDAIVLAGGAGRRLGGPDKPMADVGGVSLLDRVLAAVAGAEVVVVVGPRRSVSRDVVWCVEDPPGGGPVAAVAAGVGLTSSPVVLVLAADLPHVAPAVPILLASRLPAALVDASGRMNYLASAWPRAVLLQALSAVGSPVGGSMRGLVAGLDITSVPDEAGWGTDCDTPDDLLRARRRVEGAHYD